MTKIWNFLRFFLLLYGLEKLAGEAFLFLKTAKNRCIFKVYAGLDTALKTDRRKTVEERDLQKEIIELEDSNNIKIFDISAMGGVLSQSSIGSAIDSLTETLQQIDLDKIAENVRNDLKDVTIIA